MNVRTEQSKKIHKFKARSPWELLKSLFSIKFVLYMLHFVISLKFLFYLILFTAAATYLIDKSYLEWVPILIGFTSISWLIISGRNLLPKNKETKRILKNLFGCLILLWVNFLIVYFINQTDEKFTLTAAISKYWITPSLSMQFVTSVIETLANIFILGNTFSLAMSFGNAVAYIWPWAFKEFDE